VELGAEFIATGHYALIERNEKEVLLKKGADAKKDQSYFLCQLTHKQLSHVLFPLGGLTKTRVRQIAREMGLPAHSRPESQEICFIPDNDYTGFLKTRERESSLPGPILDDKGNILGEHHGITGYTIGQRHGLGIANAEPLYVTAILPNTNTVIAGPKAQTYGTELVAGGLNWITPVDFNFPIRIKAKIRYRHPEAEAVVTRLDNDTVYVKFSVPQSAITPGQTIAFYDGNTVTGGGIIIKQGSKL
jgi:tRNA-specific 2-thiouridylase